MMLEQNRERKIGLLGLEEFELCWGSIIESLRAIPHFWEYYTQEWFFEMCAKGNIQVWALGDDRGVEAICVTEVVQFPAIRVLRLMGASGDGFSNHIERLQDVFDGFARMQNCQRIELIGRAGWIRKFRSLRGSTYDYVVMSRPVGEQRSH